MKHYRILFNGDKYKVQGKENHWWSCWGDLGGVVHGPYWSCKYYDTRREAEEAMRTAIESSKEVWTVIANV